MDTFKIGDPVTVLPPWDDVPYILRFQHYAHVAAIRPDGCMVHLDAVFPRGQMFGPLAAHQLAPGWRDEDGRWRLPS